MSHRIDYWSSSFSLSNAVPFALKSTTNFNFHSSSGLLEFLNKLGTYFEMSRLVTATIPPQYQSTLMSALERNKYVFRPSLSAPSATGTAHNTSQITFIVRAKHLQGEYCSHLSPVMHITSHRALFIFVWYLYRLYICRRHHTSHKSWMWPKLGYHWCYTPLDDPVMMLNLQIIYQQTLIKMFLIAFCVCKYKYSDWHPGEILMCVNIDYVALQYASKNVRPKKPMP